MGNTIDVFTGGVAVVTGAGAGIGEGLARRAAELGMKVVLADIAGDRVETLAGELRAGGAEVMPITVDVGKPDELERLAEHVHGVWGDVRLLVNNAGIETMGLSWEIPANRWEQTLNVNIHGVIHGVRTFAPRMLASGKPACIANLASIGSFSVMPTQTAYMVTKHAVQAFSECLYLEMQLTGKPIQVSSIIPGMVKTRIFDAKAGEGEPDGAHGYRTTMRDMMASYGMELTEACRIIFDKLAAGEFWVDTQPEMTAGCVEDRISFLKNRAVPAIPAAARGLLGLDN